MDRIVLLGGTFNPLSKAHDRVLQTAKRKIGADKAILLPASDGFLHSWKKFDSKEIIPMEIRMKILKAYCKRHRNTLLETIEVGGITTNTYDSLSYLKKKYRTNRLYFLLGTEKATEIQTWHESEKLLAENLFIMVRRHDDDLNAIRNIPVIWKNRERFLFMDVGEETQEISSTRIREALLEKKPTIAAELTFSYVMRILQEAKIG